MHSTHHESLKHFQNKLFSITFLTFIKKKLQLYKYRFCRVMFNFIPESHYLGSKINIFYDREILSLVYVTQLNISSFLSINGNIIFCIISANVQSMRKSKVIFMQFLRRYEGRRR